MILLGHMLADLVEAETGLRSTAGSTWAARSSATTRLKQGGLDAYVEYTGTALTTILKEPPDNDPKRVLERVRTELAASRRRDLPRPARVREHVRDPDASRPGRAARHPDDLRPARQPRDVRAGFGPEFMNRPDGYPGLVRAYGLKFAEAPREMDRNLLYQAVAKGSIDLAAGDSTDGRIAVARPGRPRRTTAAISRPTRPSRWSEARRCGAIPRFARRSTGSRARSRPRRCGG